MFERITVFQRNNGHELALARRLDDGSLAVSLWRGREKLTCLYFGGQEITALERGIATWRTLRTVGVRPRDMQVGRVEKARGLVIDVWIQERPNLEPSIVLSSRRDGRHIGSLCFTGQIEVDALSRAIAQVRSAA